MTHVVTDACIRCKYTDCVDVCTVDCFGEGPAFLTIHPDECIDCAVCIPECPVGAIVADSDLPPEMAVFLELNRTPFADWPPISRRKPPQADAERWKNVPGKLATFQPAPCASL